MNTYSYTLQCMVSEVGTCFILWLRIPHMGTYISSLSKKKAFASILTGNVIWLGRIAVDPQSSDEETVWFYVPWLVEVY